MASTPNYAWPYPAPTATVDVARDIKALALAVDASAYPVGRLLAHTEQVSQPPFDVQGTSVDYTTAAWPRPTFTVPPSGRVLVAHGIQLSNTNSANASNTIYWRTSGTSVQVPGGGGVIMSQLGGGLAAGRTFTLAGMTPGTVVTLIPSWRISSGTPAVAVQVNGYVDVIALQ